MVTHAELLNFFLTLLNLYLHVSFPCTEGFFLEKGTLRPACGACDSLFPLAVPKISIGKFTLFLAGLAEGQNLFCCI